MAESKSTTSNSAIQIRKSGDRGHGDHGWLNSYHTFSFSSYYDEKFPGFHSLRVINEDRVSPSKGFSTHSHREFEIWSYVVRGSLLHKDSMGNTEVIKRGMVQFTSAGKGMSHSEFNNSEKELVHFIQLWAKPSTSGLNPSYQTRAVSDNDKEGKLRLIVAPMDSKEKEKDITVIGINQDLRMYATLIKTGESVSLDLADGHEAYVHLIQDVTGYDTEANKVAINLCGTTLKAGDGAFVTRKDPKGALKLTITGESDTRAEVLVLDVAPIKKAA